MPRKKAVAVRTEKKILITGGTGFLGQHVVEQLIDAGERNIRVLASRVPDRMKDAGVEAVEGTILNKDDVARAVKGASVILHLAGKVSRDEQDAAEMNLVHLQGTRLLSEAAVEAGVTSMILASSSGTIAVSEDPYIHDETSPQPVDLLTRWAYYASKYYQERTAIASFGGEGRRLVILNPSLLLGPGDDRTSSTRIVLDHLARRVPYIPGGGLNFVDARDAAAAFISAIEKGVDGERYLLGAANMTFAEFFGRLERLSGVGSPVMKIPRRFALAVSSMIESAFKNWGKASPVAAKEVEQAECFWYFDSEKSREVLGFDPRDPKETLNATLSYIRKNTLGADIF